MVFPRIAALRHDLRHEAARDGSIDPARGGVFAKEPA